jgi:drug/metabolite transporter (DMT)-like permease
MNSTLLYILTAVVSGAAGQLLLKSGMARLGPVSLGLNTLGPVLLRIATNPFVVGGLAIYGLSTVFWLAALSRAQLSYAYPFVSLNYLIILLVSWRLFDEHLSPARLVGTFIVALGVLIIAKS